MPFLFGDLSALCTWQGWLGNGKTILFGLVGGYFGVELAKWWVGVKTSTGDSFAVPVAIGIAIVRFADGLPRHPTQLYEVAFHLLMAVAMGVCLKEGWLSSRLIRLYFIAYAAYRFLTEFIRPEEQVLWGLTWYQFVCLGLVVLFAGMDWWTMRRCAGESVVDIQA